mmetsp:Transcript_15531/g.37661  ORF Transcript_15531/g.37661 Transcript_15531/m.37661 type:complete len:299 (-) Transcript_15531:147-1043(-)
MSTRCISANRSSFSCSVTHFAAASFSLCSASSRCSSSALTCASRSMLRLFREVISCALLLLPSLSCTLVSAAPWSFCAYCTVLSKRVRARDSARRIVDSNLRSSPSFSRCSASNLSFMLLWFMRSSASSCTAFLPASSDAVLPSLDSPFAWCSFAWRSLFCLSSSSTRLTTRLISSGICSCRLRFITLSAFWCFASSSWVAFSFCCVSCSFPLASSRCWCITSLSSPSMRSCDVILSIVSFILPHSTSLFRVRSRSLSFSPSSARILLFDTCNSSLSISRSDSACFSCSPPSACVESM